MPIDASIYNQIQQPKLDNPLNALAQVAQLQHFQSQNKLADLTYGEKQREIADQQGVRDVLTSVGNDPKAASAALMSKGYYKPALEIGKSQREADKLTGEIDKQQFDLMQAKRKFAVQNIGSLLVDPNLSYDTAAENIAAGVKDGHIDMKTATGMLQALPRDPAALRAHLQRGLISILTPEQQVQVTQPKTEFKDTGGALTGLQMNPNLPGYGQPVQGQSVKKTMTPSEAATQNSPQYMETDAGLVALPKKLAPGQVPTGTPVMGANGEALGKPLKPIPPSVNTAIINNNQSLNQIDRALTLLDGKNIGDPTKGGMQGDASATGVKGYLPNGVLNRIDPKGVAARAEISDIGSLKIHDRSGAAVTISESPRLMPFIPLATDDAVTAKKKLTRLQLELKNESAALAETYSKEQGYRPSPVNRAPTSRAPAAKAGGVVDFGDLK